MLRIQAVKPLKEFKVEITITNGQRKVVDLEPFLHGPIFQPLRENSSLFRTVHVDKELCTIVWDNGADIDPDVLIYGRSPAWMPMEKLQARTMIQSTKQLVVREGGTVYRARKHAKTNRTTSSRKR